jgi:hypothetical protein
MRTPRIFRSMPACYSHGEIKEWLHAQTGRAGKDMYTAAIVGRADESPTSRTLPHTSWWGACPACRHRPQARSTGGEAAAAQADQRGEHRRGARCVCLMDATMPSFIRARRKQEMCSCAVDKRDSKRERAGDSAAAAAHASAAGAARRARAARHVYAGGGACWSSR